jgi:hypothetical protein
MSEDNDNELSVQPLEGDVMNHVRVTKSVNPSDAQLFDRSSYGDVPVLRCPVCGDQHSHVQAVFTLEGGDESDGLYRGSHLIARETPYRRDALAVRVHGETCGHRWDVVFQQHKGNTLLRVDVLEDVASGVGAALKERR